MAAWCKRDSEQLEYVGASQKESLSMTSIERNICDRYVANESIMKLAVEYFGNKNQYYKIKNILNKHSIKIRNISERNSIYTINSDYFDCIDTEEKAYMLGFLYADGANVKGTITLSLKSIDQDILYKFNTLLGSDRPIKFYKNNYKTHYARLSIQNTKLVQNLTNYGVVERKTFSIRYPKFLNPLLDRAFIRGYFDGDGGFKFTEKLNRYNICITSNQNFCKDLQDKIYYYTGIMMHLYKVGGKHDNGIKRLEVGGNKKVLRVSEWIYADASIYLARKFASYQCLKNNPYSLKRMV